MDLVLPNPDEENVVGNRANLEPYVDNLCVTTEQAYRLVREHLATAAQRRKETYDTKVNETTFRCGDWVWYYYPRRRNGRSAKWSSFYIGPFEVVKEIPPCNYVLQKSQRAKPFVVHGDKLKLCYVRQSCVAKEDNVENSPLIEGGSVQPPAILPPPRSDRSQRGVPCRQRRRDDNCLPAELDPSVRRGERRRRSPRPFSPS
jgi:hypothetical protein